MSATRARDDEAGRSALGRDPEEIEREIEHTRQELDRTLGALQERLSPRRRLEEVVTNARESGGRLVGQVELAAKRNPVPFIVAGATLLVAIAAGVMSHRHEKSGSGGK